MIAKLLGHREIGTTQRYAHLAPDPVRHAADFVQQYIVAAVSSAESLPVTPLRREA